jgi:hypothetical protein
MIDFIHCNICAMADDGQQSGQSGRDMRKAASDEAVRQRVSTFGAEDVTTAATSAFGIWFTTKNRWIVTLVGIVLNVFANVFVFAIVFNTNSDEFVCDGLFAWASIASPSDSFMLFVGLVLIWIGDG